MSVFALISLNVAFAASTRTSAVVAVLEEANSGLSEAAREEKYGLMAESALGFFRGSNQLYWMDFGDASWLGDYGGDSETWTWLGGDMHVGNTGSFDDDRGHVVFGLNDFDEAVIGDYQLDVLRLATSLVLIARENGGFSASDEEDVVESFAESYLDARADYAANDDEADAPFEASNTDGPLDDFLDDVEGRNSRSELLDRWTVKVSGKRRLDVSGNKKLAAVGSALEAEITRAILDYRDTLSGGGAHRPGSFFKVKSVAQRLHAGVGSLGVNRYYVLIEGASSAQSDDHILDIKAQSTPSAWGWLDADAQDLTLDASGDDHAQRVMTAYKALGVHVDDMLGWLNLSDGYSYSVRELSPYKESFPTEDLDNLADLEQMAAWWGQVLATHHARADKNWDEAVFPDSLDDQIDARTDGDHAGFRALMRLLAIDNADQVELDYDSFLAEFF